MYMLDKIKAFFIYSSEQGLRLPSAFDKQSNGPSVSLLFSHIANFVAIVSICILMYKDQLQGNIAAMIYAALMICFYLLRKLSKVKFDATNKSLELDGGEEK